MVSDNDKNEIHPFKINFSKINLREFASLSSVIVILITILGFESFHVLVLEEGVISPSFLAGDDNNKKPSLAVSKQARSFI